MALEYIAELLNNTNILGTGAWLALLSLSIGIGLLLGGDKKENTILVIAITNWVIAVMIYPVFETTIYLIISSILLFFIAMKPVFAKDTTG